jgi:amino acid adenylation domain-containing protein
MDNPADLASSATPDLCWVCDIEGALDVGRFRSALRAVGTRRRALSGMPDARVLIAPRPATDAWNGELWRDALATPLETGCHSRVRPLLHQVSARHHVFSFAAQESAFDGASFGPLLAELASGYAGGPPVSPPGRLEHTRELAPEEPAGLDPAVGQEAARRVRALDEAERLDVLADRAARAQRDAGSDVLVRPLRRDLCAQVRRLAAAESTQPALILQAAVAAWLHRQSGQRDLLIGLRADTRPAGQPAAIGAYQVVVPVRVQVDGDPSFASFCRRCGDTVSAGLTDQAMLAEIARAWQAQADLPRAVISVSETPAAVELDHDVVIRRRLSLYRHAIADLELDFELAGEQMCLAAAFRTDTFSRSAVELMLERLELLLGQSTAAPLTPIGDLEVVPPAERRLVTTTWNPPPAGFTPATVPERFEAQAAKHPDRLAVTDDQGRELTYDELRREANRLARHLTALGVGPEACCAVIGNRSAASVIAILAILKAGGAYLPIEPSLPQARMAAELDDAGVVAVLTDSSLAPRLPGGTWHVVLMDKLPESLDDDGDGPAALPSPRGLAYVIYTSGSTGRPKGVLIEHGSICHFVDMVGEFFELTEDDRLVQAASLSFDVSVFEIFGALLTGASTHIAGDETRGSPGRLQALMRDRAVTVLMATPSMLELIEPDDVPDLRLMSIGGEPFTEQLVTRWANGRRFINGYGPAEATVEVVAKACQPGSGPPPIGRALSNHRAFVLDERMRQVPIGAVGELYVGGPGLARGYLARPGMTAGVFVPDPFAVDPGARLYRTGDLVRWLPTGDLMFLGRADRQVKIRGMRVELGEIEATMRRHPHVANVAVGTAEALGDKKLIAYVVPACRPTADLRAAAAQWLPAHMVPAEVVLVGAIPLTSVGKVDVRALAALREQQAGPRETGPGPRTPTEEQVAGILGEILGEEAVPVDEDFFALGANSLQALRLLSRVRSEFGVMLSPRELFDDPTVAGVAAAIDTQLVDA